MSQITRFLLNDREVSVNQPAGMLVLDYLRRTERLVGTKEGCKEGDCGACMVLVGELDGSMVSYKPMTSCLIPLGELRGKHLVTIEGLNMEHLSPVQQAIVDEGGSQCGFCTPGIVVSLTGHLMTAGSSLNGEAIKYALGGNLCRCTGYSSLKRAGEMLEKSFGNGSSVSSNGRSHGNLISRLVEQKALPDYFTTVPKRLKKLSGEQPGNSPARADYFLAGGTDLYVQNGDHLPDSKVEILNLRPHMKGIRKDQDHFRVGALTTFEEFADSAGIQKIIPDIKQYMHLNASWQIRNRATLGGNIVNASPIGDMTALLLAMESELVLERGKDRRTVPMKSFFKGYKKLAKRKDEILTEIVFPIPSRGTKIHFEKVSKRKTLDIASVNSAIKIRASRGRVESMQLSFGGVAPIPLFLRKTCDYCKGKPISPQTVQQAIQIAMSEISPISDIRGSADYKRLLVRQFMISHFTKLYPEHLNTRDFYEAH